MSPSPGRIPLVGGNWKMHFVRAEAKDFCARLLDGLGGPAGKAEIVLLPSAPLLPSVAAALDGSSVSWGGQDVHPEDEGAHTGDVSARQLADLGCRWALCGHSERRQAHGEDDELVRRKAAAAARHGLTAWICLGETLEERRGERTFGVLERQLAAVLDPQPGPFELAYEPVWAIGTGETATPEQAQEVHAFLRRLVASLLDSETAERVRIAYGGSVKPANAAELIAQPDVDGFLVGGASLDPAAFRDIISACSA